VSRCPHRLELLVEEVCAWLIIITLVVVASLVFWNLHHSKHHRPAPAPAPAVRVEVLAC
jgi:hypothetical protein